MIGVRCRWWKDVWGADRVPWSTVPSDALVLPAVVDAGGRAPLHPPGRSGPHHEENCTTAQVSEAVRKPFRIIATPTSPSCTPRRAGSLMKAPRGGANDAGKGPEGPATPLLPMLRRKHGARAMPPLQRPSPPEYGSGSPQPYAGAFTLRVRPSSLPCARRNGRASANLTARGGGLPNWSYAPAPRRGGEHGWVHRRGVTPARPAVLSPPGGQPCQSPR